MKTSPPRTEQPPNWPMKWQIKALLKDFKYVRDLSFYLLARKGISEKPSVRLYEEGEVSPDYDKPLCFFCSYDEESIVRKNVYHDLDQLKQAGQNIIFNSSSAVV